MFYKLVKFIKYTHRYEAIFLYFEVIELIKPILFTLTKPRGKKKIIIPVLLTRSQQYKKGIIWLVSNLKEKKNSYSFILKLYHTLLNIIKKQSAIFLQQKKLTKTLLVNRAFQNYR